MTIKEFIEKAIEGGWRKDENPIAREEGYTYIALPRHGKMIEKWQILLDPEAWKAVSKVQGYVPGEPFHIARRTDPQWLTRMHRMIDALAEGKTIEQYLETL